MTRPAREVEPRSPPGWAPPPELFLWITGRLRLTISHRSEATEAAQDLIDHLAQIIRDEAAAIGADAWRQHRPPSPAPNRP